MMMSHEMRSNEGRISRKMNIRKLRAKMVEEDVNVEKLSKELQMSSDALYRRFKTDGDVLTIKEANAIVKALGLTGEEATEIFFGSTVA